MTQFIAILKDSFREAMDAKIIYVLIGLAVLLMAFTATISYTPVEPKEAFDSITQRFITVFADRGLHRIAGEGDCFHSPVRRQRLHLRSRAGNARLNSKHFRCVPWSG